MRGRAFAKVNLSLRVGGIRPDGFHPIDSLIQSIDWADEILLDHAADDELVVRGADLGDRDDNLAWRGMDAMRDGGLPAVRMELDKSIAAAAGLGGGSADAALGLMLAAALFGRDRRDARAVAPHLGADVPFCLTGGLAIVEGIGDLVAPRAVVDDYRLAVVVPPFELSTPAVFRMWDDIGSPTGPEIGRRHLPASLRDHAPLINDLQPAAIAVEPTLGDWISDVGALWGQPVAMSGSGPSLVSFFQTHEEAAQAVAAVPGTRSAVAAAPVSVGWVLTGGEDDGAPDTSPGL